MTTEQERGRHFGAKTNTLNVGGTGFTVFLLFCLLIFKIPIKCPFFLVKSYLFPSKCSSEKVSNLSKGGHWPLPEAAAASSSGRWSCLERWGLGRYKKSKRMKIPINIYNDNIFWSNISVAIARGIFCVSITGHQKDKFIDSFVDFVGNVLKLNNFQHQT